MWAHVLQIGNVSANIEEVTVEKIKLQAVKSLVRCLDVEASQAMCQEIDIAKSKGDSLGGVVQVLVENVPAGIGSYVQFDRKLDAKIAAAVMSVQSVKGVYFGDAMMASSHFGSQVHDQITYDNGYTRQTNHYGGFEGGMTNGMPLVIQAMIKPIPTLYQPLQSIHIETKAVEESMIERSDTCVVPAAGVVLEAVVAIEVATAIIDEFQSNQMSQLIDSMNAYREYVRLY